MRVRLLVLTLAVMLTTAACAPADWLMFRFGPDHTGFSPDTSISKTAVQGSMVLDWTATTGFLVQSSPAVADGVVFVGSYDHYFYAFDAAGHTNCSGIPKSCAPLWRTFTGGFLESSPAVVDGVVYVGSSDSTLYAFDAAGNTNCSGTPKSCDPLWTAGAGLESAPAVADGVVYVADSDRTLNAFDAAGNTNCSGSPKTCTALWTATIGPHRRASPAVANGVVYIGSDDAKLYAFDAAGNTNCSGGPPTNTCTPLWTAGTGLPVKSSPAVTDGVVYVGSNYFNVWAFDAAGNTNCSGSPKTCSPLWTGGTGGSVLSSPAVANGVVYVGSNDNKLYAFGLERVPPTTSVVIPSNGATLSGTVTLDASAHDDVKVSRVEFHLTGGSYNNALIGTATPTQYGWIAQWDTTSVPNGAYTLNSVAYDPAGNVGRSADASITVENEVDSASSVLAPG